MADSDPMPQPTKLTPEAHKAIVARVLAGNYRETACAAAGICSRTLRDWLRRGASGKPEDAIYAAFSADLDKAEAASESRQIAALTQAAAKDWRAAAWLLEKKYPKRWGSRVEVQHSGSVSLESIDELRKRLDAGQRDAILDDEPEGGG